ncbi:hypothetical protein [Streptomyces heilongjiangensis]|uniref:hypothetical protein n=1 Tax=Streptomyces heilongjiangensis TaxID=945052 RepID=UPI0023312662|nr:hypothetical protein [Streptomyces heilongjiangensis]MDC2948223.1 hypothetical protein [Streptomyces heilongjiangensis]
MNHVVHPTGRDPLRRPAAARRRAPYAGATVTGGPARAAAPATPQYHPVRDSEEKS